MVPLGTRTMACYSTCSPDSLIISFSSLGRPPESPPTESDRKTAFYCDRASSLSSPRVFIPTPPHPTPPNLRPPIHHLASCQSLHLLSSLHLTKAVSTGLPYNNAFPIKTKSPQKRELEPLDQPRLGNTEDVWLV